MEQKDNDLQPVGVCHKLFYFIMKTLTAQALKPVTLGPPLPCDQTQELRPSAIDQWPITHDYKPSYQISSINIEPVVSPLLEDEPGEVKVEVVGEYGKKVPKKVVSIKHEPEIINFNEKKMADKQPLGFEREENRELKPLRSILKVSSRSTKLVYSRDAR